jgi:thioredoxin-like negative regulator of GroEL
VIVRKAGTPSPLPEDRLDRARRLLEGGQVEAAHAEVARLPGARQAGNWLAAAKRYVVARHALDILENAAIQGSAAQPASAVTSITTYP